MKAEQRRLRRIHYAIKYNTWFILESPCICEWPFRSFETTIPASPYECMSVHCYTIATKAKAEDVSRNKERFIKLRPSSTRLLPSPHSPVETVGGKCSNLSQQTKKGRIFYQLPRPRNIKKCNALAYATV